MGDLTAYCAALPAAAARTDPRVTFPLLCHTQDGPELDTAGSNVIQPVLGPDSSMRPNMSTCDLGSFAIGRTSHDTATDSDMEPWSPACVTWREAMATAFPIMAAWPLSVSTPGGVVGRAEFAVLCSPMFYCSVHMVATVWSTVDAVVLRLACGREGSALCGDPGCAA